MVEFASTFNDLVVAHNEREDDLAWIKSKLADLEDLSWRSNVEIKVFPETVETS